LTEDRKLSTFPKAKAYQVFLSMMKPTGLKRYSRRTQVKITLTLVLALAVSISLLVGCAGSKKPVVHSRHAARAATQPESTAVADTSSVRTLESLLETPVPEKPREEWGWIKNEWVNVRSKPSTKSDVVSRLERGDKVKLVDHAGNWWLVELKDSSEAYVYAPLIFHEPYVAPWLAFKMGCRRADSTLSLVIAVSEYDGKDDNSIYVTVADDWYNLPEAKREKVAQAAYSYWNTCLTNNGHDPNGAFIVIRDDIGKDIIKVSGSPDKPILTSLDQD
jgi:hypothetical protein